jgi:glycosyltransferase involved in cell wall biosynthesis
MRSDAPRPQLLLDLSELVRHDARSGVQRATRGLLHALLAAPPTGWEVRPVYDAGGYYAYAAIDADADADADAAADADNHGDPAGGNAGGSAGAAARHDGQDGQSGPVGAPAFAHEAGHDAHGAQPARHRRAPEGAEVPLRVAAGDIFLGLDLTFESVARNQAALASLRAHGVRLYFIVYDLIPTRHPEWFVDGVVRAYEHWLRTIAVLADGLVAISRATADDLLDWLAEQPPTRATPLLVGYAHLGADIAASAPSGGIGADDEAVLACLGGRPTLLMVGTLEPRKMQEQALEAFERLWADGVELNLVIVGKPGWQVEQLATRLRQHAERGRRLFWLERASDELLLRLYEQSSALLAASRSEGFGLPLIEAARHGLPVIARDLPVFREVGGEHAWYFEAHDGAALAAALRDWLALREAGRAPSSTAMPHLNWDASARQMLAGPLGGPWYRRAPVRLP